MCLPLVLKSARLRSVSAQDHDMVRHEKRWQCSMHKVVYWLHLVGETTVGVEHGYVVG